MVSTCGTLWTAFVERASFMHVQTPQVHSGGEVTSSLAVLVAAIFLFTQVGISCHHHYISPSCSQRIDQHCMDLPVLRQRYS